MYILGALCPGEVFWSRCCPAPDLDSWQSTSPDWKIGKLQSPGEEVVGEVQSLDFDTSVAMKAMREWP